MLEFYTALIFGFLGSLHCLGMCGPIVMAYTVPLTKSNTQKKLFLVMPHLFYNFGRTITYIILGALAGGIGSQIFQLSVLIKAERIFFIIFGILLLIGGLILAQIITLPKSLTKNFFNNISIYKTNVSKFLTMPSWSSKFFLGLLMGLLPCHLIYMMLLQAVVLGSAQKGALLMLAFGLGTTPLLISTGLFSGLLSSGIRVWADKFITVSIFMLAIFFLFRGIGYDLTMFGHDHLHHH